MDQSYIPHAIAYAACLGEHSARCGGVDNYTTGQVQAACVQPEAKSVSLPDSEPPKRFRQEEEVSSKASRIFANLIPIFYTTSVIRFSIFR